MTPDTRLPRFLHALRRRLALALLIGIVQPAPASDNAIRDLLDRADNALRSDADVARGLALEALGKLDAAPDADLELRARVVLCDALIETDAAGAERQLAAGRAALKAATSRAYEADLLNCEGELRSIAGDTPAALRLFERALAIAERNDRPDAAAESLLRRGELRSRNGDLAAAMGDLRRSLLLFDSVGRQSAAGDALNSIANLYSRLGDDTEAAAAYENLLRRLDPDKSLRDYAVIVHNLGRVKEAAGDWPAARREYELALDLSRRVGNSRIVGYALRGLAAVRLADHQPDSALDLLDEAAAQLRKAPDNWLDAQILLQRGLVLQALHRPAEALTALEAATVELERSGALFPRATAHMARAQIHAELAQWQAAYENTLRAKAITENVLRSQIDQRYAILKVEHDTASREHENALLLRERAAIENSLQQERRANRFKLVAIVLTGILAATLGTILLRLRRSAARMQLLAMTDELTGLPNRRAVLERLDRILGKPSDKPCSVLIADIDHFKLINDGWGHLVGDEVLKTLALLLRSGVREPMALGRLGGEEFLVVLPETGLAAAHQVAERLRLQVAALDTRGLCDDRQLTMSIGVAVGLPGRCSASELLSEADTALYVAKAAGRNRVHPSPAPTTPEPMATPG
ncbi:diguanylate cyclase [Derxia gummosa]|uniref:diguanylate cyclase n=1 Tax=Derxia gummosa DSM 723 TaxID=1121388 RepID=A0A8B6X5T5_9BURK|nr:diguanylate cyclase [Derxia gummosa]